jgi:hypothetical protein
MWILLGFLMAVVIPGWPLIFSVVMGIEGFLVVLGGSLGRWAAVVGTIALGLWVTWVMVVPVLIWHWWGYLWYTSYLILIPGTIAVVTGLAAREIRTGDSLWWRAVMRMRWAALAGGLVLSTVLIVVWVLPRAQNALDPTEPMPSQGSLQVGIPYQLTLSCPAEFVAGEVRWRFDATGQGWPEKAHAPWDLWYEVVIPYPAPGALILTSESKAVWVADDDGSQWLLTAVPPSTNPTQSGCL